MFVGVFSSDVYVEFGVESGRRSEVKVGKFEGSNSEGRTVRTVDEVENSAGSADKEEEDEDDENEPETESATASTAGTAVVGLRTVGRTGCAVELGFCCRKSWVVGGGAVGVRDGFGSRVYTICHGVCVFLGKLMLSVNERRFLSLCYK